MVDGYRKLQAGQEMAAGIVYLASTPLWSLLIHHLITGPRISILLSTIGLRCGTPTLLTLHTLASKVMSATTPWGGLTGKDLLPEIKRIPGQSRELQRPIAERISMNMVSETYEFESAVVLVDRCWERGGDG